MSAADETLRVIGEVFAAFRAHDVARFSALLAERAVLRNPSTGEAYTGPDTIAAVVGITLRRRRAWRRRGDEGGDQHRPALLPSGEIPPTGRRVRMAECVVFEVRGGRVEAMSVYVDTASVLSQLGL